MSDLFFDGMIWTEMAMLACLFSVGMYVSYIDVSARVISNKLTMTLQEEIKGIVEKALPEIPS